MNTCQSKLEIRQLSKAFDQKQVLGNINLTVNQGEIVSLLGASGVGKTTLFHCISGLLSPDEGGIFLEGTEVTGEKGHIAYMLQKNLLLPHKTLVENLALPLLLQKVPKKTAYDQVKQHLPTFGLEGYGDFYPSALSGGMGQRAALLRTYLCGKEMLLLDEPFSALDAMTKREMHQWYVKMMQELGLSTLLITHDMDEALCLSQRIYLLAGTPGKVVFTLSLPQDKGADFSLSPTFLSYKKEIIQVLSQYTQV